MVRTSTDSTAGLNIFIIVIFSVIGIIIVILIGFAILVLVICIVIASHLYDFDDMRMIIFSSDLYDAAGNLEPLIEANLQPTFANQGKNMAEC